MEHALLLCGGILAVVAMLYVTANKEQHIGLTKRFFRRGRKAFSASTPPPSVASEKKPDLFPYSRRLPPLRRESLNDIPLHGSIKPERNSIVTEDTVNRSSLPMTSNYMTCDEVKFTPTGFSTEEIKAMGDFPDYATLSGVPLPDPYPEFDIDKAIPRPYRPFRWSYHQTMSLNKLEHNWWIELENTYKERIVQRKTLYEKNGKTVLDQLPGSELACKELMEMVIQFICARYPQYFSLSQDKKVFNNRILNQTVDLQSKPPMEILMENIPEDFGLMLRDDKTGYYYLRAGAICSALGWNLETKMGMQLNEIHGSIPDYKEKLQFSMDRYFSKMPTDKPIQRASWGLEVGEPLYMPPGDPHELHRESQNPSLTLPDCFLRVDWQTLRRLPLSGAIVFNFKALFTPIADFREEPGIPALLTTILKEGKESIMAYKSTWHVEHVAIPAFEEWAKEQEDRGLVEKGWEVSTLVDSPFYKGWEDRWVRRQGF